MNIHRIRVRTEQKLNGVRYFIVGNCERKNQ